MCVNAGSSIVCVEKFAQWNRCGYTSAAERFELGDIRGSIQLEHGQYLRTIKPLTAYKRMKDILNHYVLTSSINSMLNECGGGRYGVGAMLFQPAHTNHLAGSSDPCTNSSMSVLQDQKRDVADCFWKPVVINATHNATGACQLRRNRYTTKVTMHT
ncbi:hypothetical protein CBL_05651 [Carabus blaptoides fortunei]